MKNRKVIVAFLVIVCLLTGCSSNSAVDVYDSNKKIASDTNTYNWSIVK